MSHNQKTWTQDPNQAKYGTQANLGTTYASPDLDANLPPQPTTPGAAVQGWSDDGDPFGGFERHDPYANTFAQGVQTTPSSLTGGIEGLDANWDPNAPVTAEQQDKKSIYKIKVTTRQRASFPPSWKFTVTYSKA